jgi:hypothetical protein
MAKKTDKPPVPQATQKLSKASRAPAKPRKEVLFEDFYRAADTALNAFEIQFGIHGVCDKILGTDSLDDDARMRRLRGNPAWATLSTLYDYAIEGLDQSPDGPSSLVIDGSDVLWLVTSENHWPCDEWRNIVAMGDGRFALDDGQPVDEGKIALLANVDLRTVRNAISAGDLIAIKRDDTGLIENASAHRWLRGRKGFKPTILHENAARQNIATINTPAVLGAFLAERRRALGIDFGSRKVFVILPGVTSDALAQLESGIFSLPLDAVFPLADFYQINRDALLNCVMRVFYSEELKALHEERRS